MDSHVTELLDEYKANLPIYKTIQKIVLKKLNGFSDDFNTLINSITSRIKAEDSLQKKLELKGSKYQTILDVTDIVGARIVTFYADDVDKFAAKIEQTFMIDFENSIDKRRLFNIDQFGYMSVHYICTIPKEMYYDENNPEINNIRFEIQIRSVLQHAWATIEHDTGYKSDVEIPKEYLRALNRLASLLELADESFCDIRNSLDDYRRRVRQVVSSGNFADVDLNIDTLNMYVENGGFQTLNKKIATINNMEIQEANVSEFLNVFKAFRFKTLKDLDDFVKEYSNMAYEFSIRQFDGKDIDIITSVAGPLALSIVFVAKNGMGESIVKRLLDLVYGERKSNEKLASRLMQICRSMGLTKD